MSFTPIVIPQSREQAIQRDQAASLPTPSLQVLSEHSHYQLGHREDIPGRVILQSAGRDIAHFDVHTLEWLSFEAATAGLEHLNGGKGLNDRVGDT